MRQLVFRSLRSLRSFEVPALTIALAAFAFGCSSGSSSGPDTGSPPAPVANGGDPGGSTKPAAGKATVRVVHASADAPKVDVYAAGGENPIVTGLAYGDASPYIEVNPGSTAFELRASPSTSSDPVAFTSPAVAIAAGDKITAVAAGRLASKDGADALRVLPLVEGFDAAKAGSAIVRVVHASPDAPAVGVDVGDDDPRAPEIPSLARFADTGASGVALPSGAALRVGIDAAGSRVTSFTTPKLPDGAEVFVIAVGNVARLARQPSGFALLAVGPGGSLGFVRQDPVVYALHASPDAPAVDLFAGEAELADGLAFGQLSAPIQVSPGAKTIDFYAHAEGGERPDAKPAAEAVTASLVAGERYLAVATGFLAPKTAAEPAFQLAAFQEGFALDDAGATRLRVVHASPDAPGVDVGHVQGAAIAPVVFSSIHFGKSSSDAGLSLAPKHYALGVTPAGQDASIVARFAVTATPGARAFGVAAGALGAGRGQAFRLLVVDTATSPWTAAAIAPY